MKTAASHTEREEKTVKKNKWLVLLLSATLAASSAGMSACSSPLELLLREEAEESESSSSVAAGPESGEDSTGSSAGDGQDSGASSESAPSSSENVQSSSESDSGKSGAQQDTVADFYAEVEASGKKGTKTEGFDDFLEDSCLDMISDSYTSVQQYYGDDYASAGLEKPDPTFGEAAFSDFDDTADYCKEVLDELRAYDYDALTASRQEKYTIFERYLENTYVMNRQPYFQMYFSGSGDAVSGIISSLGNFIFYSEEDFKDFIDLADSVPDYLASVVKVTKKQADAGYFITDAELDNVCSEIETYCDAGEGCSTILHYEDALDAFDGIPEADKQELKNKLKDSVINGIIPSFQDTEDALKGMQGSRDGDDTLCSLKGGADYYQVMVRDILGYDADLDDIASELQGEIEEISAHLYALAGVMDESAITEEPYLADAKAMMDYLEKHMQDYPSGPDVSYSFSYLEGDQESGNVAAYYLMPTLTHPTDNNIIRISNSVDDKITLYTTLAHEGMPGHMYEYTRKLADDPSLFFLTTDCLGFGEGWAQYAEYQALLEAPMSAEACKYQALMDELNYAILALGDVEFNGLGMSTNDLARQITKAGFSSDYSKSVAEDIYSSVTAGAGTFLSYGYGMVAMLNLRDEAEAQLGDSFDVVAYHEAVLDSGNEPLDMLQDRMADWIRGQKYSQVA